MLGVDFDPVSFGLRVDDCTALWRPFTPLPDFGRIAPVGGLGGRPFCGILGKDGVVFFWLEAGNVPIMFSIWPFFYDLVTVKC